MSMKHEARLGLPVHWIQQALMTAYEDNCYHRLTKGSKISEVDIRIKVPPKRIQTAL